MKRLLAVVVFCSICSTLARAEDAPPAADVDNSTDFVLSTLPADDAAKLPADDKDLARIAESLKSAKLAQYHKTNVRVLDKTPFVSAAEPVAVVLDSKKEQTIVGVNKSVQHVIVLFAVLDPGKDPLAQLTALRSDGVPTRTKFNPGENCGPSIGGVGGQTPAQAARIHRQGRGRDQGQGRHAGAPVPAGLAERQRVVPRDGPEVQTAGPQGQAAIRGAGRDVHWRSQAVRPAVAVANSEPQNRRLLIADCKSTEPQPTVGLTQFAASVPLKSAVRMFANLRFGLLLARFASFGLHSDVL